MHAHTIAPAFSVPSVSPHALRVFRYPSIMIAYNMCFSTLMGRIARKRGNVWPEEILAERVGCFMHAPAHELIAKAFGGRVRGECIFIYRHILCESW